MKFMKSGPVFAVAVFCLAGAGAEGAMASPSVLPGVNNTVVAKVDGIEIRRSDLMMAMRLLPRNYRKMPLESVYPLLLRQVINNTLVVRAAKAEGFDKSDSIRQRLAAIERRLIEGAYMQHAAKGKITDTAMRRRYQGMIDSRRGKEEIHVRHILVKSKSEAQGIIEKLSGGADFAALAREASMGPSRAKGGDLGYMEREEMVAPFADAAFGLRTGRFTPMPIQTRFGWHVIKLEGRRAATTPSFEELRPQLARQIRARIADALVKKLRRNAKIEEFDINGNPKPGVRQNK